jgi:hypothetical protein
MPVSLLASGEGTAVAGVLTSDTLSVFKTAFEAVQTDVTSMVTTALPIGLGIMGLFLAIRLGVGFFKSVAN